MMMQVMKEGEQTEWVGCENVPPAGAIVTIRTNDVVLEGTVDRVIWKIDGNEIPAMMRVTVILA